MSNPGQLYTINTQQPTPSVFSQAVLDGFVRCVVNDMNKYGLCALDKFLGRLCSPSAPLQISEEVSGLHSSGRLEAGQVVGEASLEGAAERRIRSDLISWVSGEEPHMKGIGTLMAAVDCVMRQALSHPQAGELAHYNISLRTKAMAACYPGGKSRYIKHVDNPNEDGRVITTIYYVNQSWTAQDGGELRIYSNSVPNRVANIEPHFDRVVFFWSDKRNPHEVRPANSIRFAVTIWYLDDSQRKRYIQAMRTRLVQQQRGKLSSQPSLTAQAAGSGGHS